MPLFLLALLLQIRCLFGALAYQTARLVVVLWSRVRPVVGRRIEPGGGRDRRRRLAGLFQCSIVLLERRNRLWRQHSGLADAGAGLTKRDFGDELSLCE